jgi:uncharacterized protein
MTDGLITVQDGQQHLIGGRCTSCATHTFPMQAACPKCGSGMAQTALPNTGTVWSWTVQRFAPKPPYVGPVPYQPFALAYVDLGPVKVETPLRGRPVDAWKIGHSVRLAAGDPNADGAHFSFSFEPLESVK